MMLGAVDMESAPAVAPQPDPDALTRAFLEEARLLDELLQVLEEQRAAVAAGSAEDIEAGVFVVHRLLRTLEQARDRRRALLRTSAGGETQPLRELERVLHSPPRQLLHARDELVVRAEAVARQIEINRRVLQRAFDAGETVVRAISEARGGSLLNQKA